MTRRLILVLRLLLAAVFLYAAYTKLRQPWLVFALSIDAYRLLPEWAVLVAARVLPWLELAVGLLLLGGAWLRWSSSVAALLLGAFFATMVAMYGKGAGIDCGCFGLGEAISPSTLVRDGLLLAAALALAVLAVRSPRAPAVN
jgi:uncharacterized membrane protein YphA (DoxX/SURF4 family)